MTDFAVTKEVSDSKGRYVIRKDGEEAELTFSVLTPTRIIADHTEVPDSFRGMGVGLALASEMVRDARASGFTVVPLCPFVNAQRRKHPDWADVFQV